MAAAKPDAERRAQARRQTALGKRIEGASWPEIAVAMRGRDGVAPSYDAKQAAADVLQSLRDLQALLAAQDEQDSKDLLRVLELARLDGYTAHAERLRTRAQADGEMLDELRAIDRLLRISARRDALMALAETAEVPPSPEADEVDELKQRREDNLLKASGSA